jgi:hypothetical protein
LQEIGTSARAFAKSFLAVRDKWKYYQAQRDFIFGENPDNEGPNEITNAVDGYSTYLERWATIKNKEEKQTLDLLEPVINFIPLFSFG